MAKALDIKLAPVSVETALTLHKLWNSIWSVDPSTADSYLMEMAGKPSECFVGYLTDSAKPVLVMMFSLTPELEMWGFAISHDAPYNSGSRAVSLAAKELKRLYPHHRKMVSYSVVGRYDMALYKASAFIHASTIPWKGMEIAKLERDL